MLDMQIYTCLWKFLKNNYAVIKACDKWHDSHPFRYEDDKYRVAL